MGFGFGAQKVASLRFICVHHKLVASWVLVYFICFSLRKIPSLYDMKLCEFRLKRTLG